jgi:hypothetical protein
MGPRAVAAQSCVWIRAPVSPPSCTSGTLEALPAGGRTGSCTCRILHARGLRGASPSVLTLHQEPQGGAHHLARGGVATFGYLGVNEASQGLGQGDVAGVRNRHASDIAGVQMGATFAPPEMTRRSSKRRVIAGWDGSVGQPCQNERWLVNVDDHMPGGRVS